MKHGEFIKNKSSIVAKLREAFTEKFMTINQACEYAGICYQHEWISYLTVDEQQQLKALVATKGDRKKFLTGGNSLRDSMRSCIKESNPNYTRSSCDGEFNQPSKLPFYTDASRPVCRQQVRLAIMAIIGQLDGDESYLRTLEQKLNELVARGFITKEMSGRLKFCLEGLKLTLNRIP